MAFGKTKTRTSPVGIDFGADTVKLLQVMPGEPPELVALASAVIPDEARSDAGLRLAFLADTLPDLLRRGGFRGRRVALSIPSFQAMVHNVVVPKADAADLDAVVAMALRERLDLDPDKMILRNYLGATLRRDGQDLQEVLVFGARRGVATRYAELVTRMKLEVVGMHSEAPCLLKAFAHLNRSREAGDRRRATVYIDLGAGSSKLVVVRDGAMALAKTIHAGGDSFTRRLAGERSVSFDEARSARRTEDPGPVAAIADGPAAAAACDITECLIDELRMLVRHYASREPERPIEKLVFVGGEANRRDLVTRLARAVRLPAQLGDPFARLARGAVAAAGDVDPSVPQPGWAVPLGLCLSDAPD